MAHHKSALKRIRQTETRTIRNRSMRSSFRTTVKQFMDLLEEGKAQDALKSLPDLQKTIDKMVSKGILKKETANRKKSRITIALNNQLAEAKAASAA